MAISYDTDFYTWTQSQAALLRSGNLGAVDVDHLLMELDSMGARERRELENRLVVLLLHLLKWQYQSGRRGNSWEATIRLQRLDIRDYLLDNPGLKPRLLAILERAYPKARLGAMGESGLPFTTFAEICLWSLTQVCDEAFWPN